MIGQYEVLRVLGEGGFGRTYVGRHALLGKKAVLKQSLYAGPAAERILLEEAALLWDINHWALPTVKDVLREDGSLVMVLSFIEGSDLAKYVAKKGPVGPENTCWITQRVLSALYYLHFRGIVHRDVKPANIIGNFDTHIATLVDFGLSKLKPDGSPDPSGYTPIFGAPEQIAGRAPIPESDLYGLGMTMIYLLGGDLRTKELPGVPDPLREFVHALVRDDPRERPRDAKKLNDEVGRLREELFGRPHML
jgi:serine/threonine protein kinase